jgi:hypothetical protein
MDAHFQEYLAAIAGMHDIYGDSGDDRPSEFHETAQTPTARTPTPQTPTPQTPTPQTPTPQTGPVTWQQSDCPVVPG